MLHIEKHVIPVFSRLMIRMKNTDSLSEADKEEFHGRFRKWGNRPLFLKRKRKVSIVEQRNKTREVHAKIPIEKYQVDALVKVWIEYGGIKLRPIARQLTPEEKRDPRYCLHHRRVGHPTLNYYTVRKIYHNKVQRGVIIQDAENNPLPSHKSFLTCTTIEENLEP